MEYDIPRSTLGDHIQCRVLPGAVGCRQPYLTPREEKELADFIIRSSEIGFPRGRKEIIALVQNVCDGKGLKVKVSHGWWEHFCQRNTGFSLRVAASLSRARLENANSMVIKEYFDMLEETLAENDLIDKPCRIFNMDESGVPLAPKPPNCYVKEFKYHFL